MLKWLRLATVVALAAVTVLSRSTAADAQELRPDPSPLVVESRQLAREEPQALYLVRLVDPPLAGYRGGLAGLAPTSPEVTGNRKLDPNSPQALAYRSFLQARQDDFRTSVAQTIGRLPEVSHRYIFANNGLALRLTPVEASQIASLPEVAFIQPDFERQLHTDAGPQWIGADSIWDGSGTGGLGSTKGEGIVIGVIDTGINPSNPSFAAVGPKDGHTHVNPYGSGNFTPGSYCTVTDPSLCNDKLIGTWNFTTDPDPIDNNGHGTHTASTAGGNKVDATLLGPGTSAMRSISGVAPHANIIAYKACVAGCSVAALTGAIDQAVADGVDVINYSIGSTGPSSVWSDFDTVGFLNARTAGIFVATSAGNSGPGFGTMGAPADAPWLTTIGASSHDRVYWNVLQNMSGGSTQPPVSIAGKGFSAALPATPIVHAKNFGGDDRCLASFPAGTFSGEIVVCNRGYFSRVGKGENILAGGAGGMVLANQPSDGESMSLDHHVLPTTHIGYTDAQALEAWLDSGSGHMATMSGKMLDVDPLNGDLVGSFSSRGPNLALPGIIKPDVAAPGVDVAAAHGIGDPSPDVWAFLGGTSMSSPHVAGAAALMTSLHPTWTPAEIESALMMTSHESLTKEDLATPADPFDRGSGSVRLGDAARVGLVLNETEADYLAANPDTGGVPEQLNRASMGDASCPGQCNWTRVVRSTLSTSMDWVASVTNPPNIRLTVTPAAFSLPAGGSKLLTVTALVDELAPPDAWRFGSIELAPSTGPSLHVPVAIANNPPHDISQKYSVSTSATSASCLVPYGDGGYLNLQDFAIFPASTVSGNGINWSAFSVGAAFEYYGSTYNGWEGSDDGFGFFDAASYGGSPGVPQMLPNAALPNGVQAAMWADLEIIYDATTNRGVTLGTLGGDTATAWAIVEYDDPVPAGGGTSVGDFQMWMRRTPDVSPGAPEIVFAYDNVGALPTLATIGLENLDGSKGAALLNPGNPNGVISNDFKVCFDLVADFSSCVEDLVVTGYDVGGIEQFRAQSSITTGSGFNVLATGQASLMTDASGVIVFFNGTTVEGELVAGNQPGVCP